MVFFALAVTAMGWLPEIARSANPLSAQRPQELDWPCFLACVLLGNFQAGFQRFQVRRHGKTLKVAVLQGLFSGTLVVVSLMASVWTFEVGGQNRFLLAAGVGAGIGLTGALLDIWAEAKIQGWDRVR
jgi:hypothetical protein